MKDLMKQISQHRSLFIVRCVTILFVFLMQNLCAQNIFKGVIKGTVVDDSTNVPLPLANIFIAGSTIGSVTNSDGTYQIKTVPFGTHQVIASIVGHIHKIVTVDMLDTTVKVIMFRLKPQNLQLSTVDIEGSEPTEWKHHLQKFIAQFLGSTPNAAQCKLLNPEVLDFTADEKKSELTATVRAPLVIENKALGYRLRFYLKYFQLKNEELSFFGSSEFEQLHPESAEDTMRWKMNRQNTYYGSRRHFFSTLFHKYSKEEGFEVTSIPNEQFRSTRYYRNIIELDPDTLIADGDTKYEKKLFCRDILQVVYGKGLFKKRLSRFELKYNSIIIYSNGEMAEPLGISTFGYWSDQRIAEFLPSDYEP